MDALERKRCTSISASEHFEQHPGTALADTYKRGNIGGDNERAHRLDHANRRRSELIGEQLFEIEAVERCCRQVEDTSEPPRRRTKLAMTRKFSVDVDQTLDLNVAGGIVTERLAQEFVRRNLAALQQARIDRQ